MCFRSPNTYIYNRVHGISFSICTSSSGTLIHVSTSTPQWYLIYWWWLCSVWCMDHCLCVWTHVNLSWATSLASSTYASCKQCSVVHASKTFKSTVSLKLRAIVGPCHIEYTRLSPFRMIYNVLYKGYYLQCESETDKSQVSLAIMSDCHVYNCHHVPIHCHLVPYSCRLLSMF